MYWYVFVGFKWVLMLRNDSLCLRRCFSGKFYCWLVFICLFNELFDDVSVGAPMGENFIDVTIPNDWFVSAFVLGLHFNF